jgi:hypothetical protein
MSALHPKADMAAGQTNVRFVPKADAGPLFFDLSQCGIPPQERNFLLKGV